jgi:hypothetical protein
VTLARACIWTPLALVTVKVALPRRLLSRDTLLLAGVM